ncbi:MAG: CBS domain-containing protein [Acidimicrobiia bacterium]|nr:CBS domain-containing protein [Acidimicrobiia bacterium]
MNIAESLASTPVSELDLSRYVTVGPTATVTETVDTMNAAGRSVAFVVSDDTLVGVFTQRDYLMRILGRSQTWQRPITEEMTRSVRSITTEQTAADGLAVMNEWWVRSVPVLASDGTLAGNLSYYVLMARIADLVAERIDEVDVNLAVRHSLTLIDFTGLNTSAPVMARTTDTVETAAHQMRARAIGSILVVDGHDNLVGVLTEFDLQREVACGHDDLSTVAVTDIMSPEPISLAVRSPIIDAVREMANRGFSHLPLLGESGRPVAVASFRDIAAYMEASFAALT